MLKAIALWLLRWLEGALDPEAQARLEALKQKVADAEAEEKRLLAEIAERQELNRQLGLERANIQLENRLEEARIDELIARRQGLAQTAKEAQEHLDSLSDRDRVRVDL